ncbi:hypothetical protein C8Q75DRAFT_808499 [Abortiporus biennis]|nr:hypothetical protein C8Q75DRAFT_808499 [Abortiporus biennis]
MRIKFESSPPLPIFKAWFYITKEKTLSELKTGLAAQISSNGNKFLASDLLLLLDDFELLDSSSVEILREGDTIQLRRRHVKQTQQGVSHNIRRQNKEISQVSSSSSSTESTSSDSETSDDESEEDSDSSSESSGVAEANKTSQVAPNVSRRPTTGFVPPGQGKAATRSRNLRRRRKKEYERSNSIVTNANEVPLIVNKFNDAQSTVEKAETTYVFNSDLPTPFDFVASGVFNKNKKKGFRSSISAPIPKKIVFETNSPPLDGEFKVLSGVQQTGTQLIPPSTRQSEGSLPKNMFVTSVYLPASGFAEKTSQSLTSRNPEYKTVEVELEQKGGDLEEEWAVVMAKFDSLEKICSRDQIVLGSVVIWKELGIDPISFTPEWLTKVGRVVASEDSILRIRLIHPALSWDERGGPSGTEDVEMSDVDDEVECQWTDVLSGDWRIAQEV